MTPQISEWQICRTLVESKLANADQSDNLQRRLTTLSAAGSSLDGTLNSLRYVASDPEASGNSFGVYRLAMAAGAAPVRWTDEFS